MKNLFRQLQPHWRAIIIIIIFHIFHAYTILLLPEYTSKLIDVGIQNQGFSEAAPLAMTSQMYNLLMQITLPEESDVLETYYHLDEEGHYRLESDIIEQPDQMSFIGSHLELPLAIYQISQEMSQEQINTMTNQVDFASLDIETIRDQLSEQLASLGDSTIHNAAMQAVASQHQATNIDTNQYQQRYLLREGSMMVFVSLLSVVFALVSHYFSATVGAAIGHRLRENIFAKVLQFSQKEVDRFSTASLITRSTNDIQQIQLVMTLFLRVILFSPVMAIGGILHVIRTGASMSWIVGLAVTLVVLMVGLLLYLTMPRFKQLQELIDRVNLIAREILTGLQVIRAFGRQDFEGERFDSANVKLRDTYLYVGRIMSLMMPIMLLIMNGISVLIIWVGGHHIADGNMQVGELTAYINYTMQIIFSFLMFSMMGMQIPRSIVASDRVYEVLDAEISIHDQAEPVLLEEPKGLVHFENVAFRYEGADENILEGITFTAEPGKTTAIIGSTGSGKSTLLHLLLRFYDVSKGSIAIDGVDIREMSLKQLRDLIGFVPQKGVLFSGTIQSNVAYGDSDLSVDKMEEAADIAHATEFIDEKAEGYQSTIAQGGSNVSGGQKQRLSIARAIAKQPKIFLFDDSFSALDYRTDASLRKALAEKIQDATVIIVAQRISTVLNADQIIVLEEGRIVGKGDHLELMESSQVYREIASSQLSQTEIDRQKESINRERLEEASGLV
ncbi:ABC transporter ATP-binding protein [Fundicoccus culcitae]|uniref:ABC transporter ATP-binding protein/permease n=1 Tax=Fundicoccus culcitae TaxID=2969821 RepID=A0ABY5P2Y9_9LACT|nr:ABC transporter ATP-binding protein [Fundicoccus culcitae]UUX32971.1 ABC transporter ATP-binding protein/permease [Fundicoccus culcitae]